MLKTRIATNIKLITTKLWWFLVSILVLFSVSPAGATDYTSSSFILRDPVITVSGGRSTAPSFEFFSSDGQTAPGESTSSSFIYRAGFLYFEAAAAAAAAAAQPSVSGGVAPAGVKVIFSGKAYPNSTVALLKDAQIAKTVLADNNGNFIIELGGLFPGDYIFSIYGKDYTGKSSKLLLFSVKDISNKDTVIGDILISPTISKDKKEVERAKILSIFGQSIPNAEVTITIETPTEDFSVKTFSDDEGKYKYELDTLSLNFGEYRASSEVSFGKTKSKSTFVSFIVGDKTILEEPIICPPKGDINNDCAVNLVDFSILIYWFDRPDVPQKIDLDGNGIADLVDFSIMAYYWTG